MDLYDKIYKDFQQGCVYMKKIKVFLGIAISLIIAIIGTSIGLSVWANKPRGIRIDLETIKEY